ncbi:hypothetical protein BGZ80_005373 [Entomortierella chlamydospora]|uniref:Uncharacterized protein n=1 Tax=Entomortierella chlamydospora TaxID=101097 RepID=A0A9P6MJY3_9FUNG|nr:hypothetical protein BGZ80_005373 [Entomortierella chlamydospora]
MATYKQRTPYQRHTASYSDEEDPGSSNKLSTTNLSVNLNSYQHHSSNSASYLLSEDDILENTSDREWTSIRNSSASARARARQQQYLDQQQQRTREWQFVLAQHHQSFLSHSTPATAATTTTPTSTITTTATTSLTPTPTSTTTPPATATASRVINPDDYDEPLSGTEIPSVVNSPRVTDVTSSLAEVSGGGEHSGYLGFSDLTSDGLESVLESEDMGVWSHEDDEDPMQLSTPSLLRPPLLSSPLAASSTTSLSNLPRPSFAANLSSQSINEPKFQNQMPFHDGSGNFFATQSIRSNLESDIDSELGWETSSSRASSVFNAYRATHSPIRRRISSSEFKAVIQNIADLQHTTSRQHIMQDRSRSRGGADSGYFFSPASDSRPHFTYPNVVTKRPIFNIYESDMEDMAAMVKEEPTKISWLQAFEKAMTLLNSSEYDVPTSDPTMVHPIKALAQHLTPKEEEVTPSENKEYPTTPESSTDSVTKQVALQQVKQNMAAASLETMTRLQTRKRSNSHRRNTSDPMQVDFVPTMRERSMYEEVQRKERRTMSRSTGTSTSMSDTNLLAVVISTLRRFRDHVKSNLLYPSDFYDEEDRQSDLARSLGFDGDLGIEWLANGATRKDGGRTGGTGGVDNIENAGGSTSTNLERPARRHERTPSYASSSRSSSRQNIRRSGSDCGLESMRHYRSRESHHSIHSSHYRPSLVE